MYKKIEFKHIELRAKLLDYSFKLRSHKSNFNQSRGKDKILLAHVQRICEALAHDTVL